MDYKVVFDNCALLFEYFGWYSILLVIGTTGLMIPLNLLYKKLMKKDGLQRLRKVIGSLSVYVIALGLVALFTGVVVKAPLTAGYLFSAILPLGLMSQLLWAVIKVIKDYGFAPIAKSIAQSKEVKEWFASMGVDKNIINSVVNSLNTYLADTNVKTLDEFVANEFKINQDLRTKLAGFVDTANLDSVVSKIMEQAKSKYSNKTE